VQHHHQRRTVVQPRRAIQMEGSADPADLDALGGLADRDRSRTRCSECVTAADAAIEYYDQGSEETHDKCPKVWRAHGLIVAVLSIFDK
jgi:hypothetical protein